MKFFIFLFAPMLLIKLPQCDKFNDFLKTQLETNDGELKLDSECFLNAKGGVDLRIHC